MLRLNDVNNTEPTLGDWCYDSSIILLIVAKNVVKFVGREEEAENAVGCDDKLENGDRPLESTTAM